MGRVDVFAVGTYYKPSSPLRVPNMSPMRGLVYLVKETTGKPVVPNHLRHPMHPDDCAIMLSNADEACEYVAEIVRSSGAFKRATLVPIPSSDCCGKSYQGRWPARRLARALEAAGVGTVRELVWQKAPMRKSHDSTSRITFDELVKNYASIRAPIGSDVVFVDDVLTWGTHIAAADSTVGASSARAIVVGTTDGDQVQDCYEARTRTVLYETGPTGSAVNVV